MVYTCGLINRRLYVCPITFSTKNALPLLINCNVILDAVRLHSTQQNHEEDEIGEFIINYTLSREGKISVIFLLHAVVCGVALGCIIFKGVSNLCPTPR